MSHVYFAFSKKAYCKFASIEEFHSFEQIYNVDLMNSFVWITFKRVDVSISYGVEFCLKRKASLLSPNENILGFPGRNVLYI